MCQVVALLGVKLLHFCRCCAQQPPASVHAALNIASVVSANNATRHTSHVTRHTKAQSQLADSLCNVRLQHAVLVQALQVLARQVAAERVKLQVAGVCMVAAAAAAAASHSHAVIRHVQSRGGISLAEVTAVGVRTVVDGGVHVLRRRSVPAL